MAWRGWCGLCASMHEGDGVHARALQLARLRWSLEVLWYGMAGRSYCGIISTYLVPLGTISWVPLRASPTIMHLKLCILGKLQTPK